MVIILMKFIIIFYIKKKLSYNLFKDLDKGIIEFIIIYQ